MEWLNYHHLLYFWTVAREGSISRAADRLGLSQPTISAQVKMLESALGERLFQRKGRTLVLTDVGRIVDGYADEIFTVGRELLETLKGRPSGRAPQLTVGVADAMPKLVVSRLLRPVTEGSRAVQIICRRGASGSARGATRDARARRGHQRHAGGAARPRQGVQSPAR